MAKLDSIPHAWPPRFWEVGFGGRTFLTEDEWRTYLRRPPVRRGYIRFRQIHGNGAGKRCVVCRKTGSAENPIQAAHRINALNGVRYLALTPEFLDEPGRLVWAHRRICNLRVEMNFAETLAYLHREGIQKLPSFLPRRVLNAWKSYVSQSNHARA